MFSLISEGEQGREREHQYERETSVAFHMYPNWGQSPQPGYVPKQEMEPETLWCTGQASTN